jgi:phosphatidylserine/phosphatidylglycerophosphate/cardiolipin synthase-like enzyme
VRLLLSSERMADFLDTTAISYNIEKLLKSARQRIILISPYLKFRPRIRELIEDAIRRNVVVQIVHGKSLRCDEAERFRVIKGVHVTFCKNVHAKCYLNEDFGIVTSLNLYDFSEAKNQEMGILFRRSSDFEIYQQAVEEAERIIRIGSGDEWETAGANVVASTRGNKASRMYDKLTTAKLAKKLGIESRRLFDKLVGQGYLELRDGHKHYLTPKGENAGGEFRMGNGPYFLWPTDLQV